MLNKLNRIIKSITAKTVYVDMVNLKKNQKYNFVFEPAYHSGIYKTPTKKEVDEAAFFCYNNIGWSNDPIFISTKTKYKIKSILHIIKQIMEDKNV